MCIGVQQVCVNDKRSFFVHNIPILLIPYLRVKRKRFENCTIQFNTFSSD